MLGFRRNHEAAPQVFTLFCLDWLALSRGQAEQWWTALGRSTTPQAVQMRSAVLCMAALPYSRARLEHLARHNLHPKTCIEALEALIGEALMSRQEAGMIEETILASQEHAAENIRLDSQ